MNKDWVTYEIEYLKENFATTSNNILSHRLGRSLKSVENKAYYLGLRKQRLDGKKRKYSKPGVYKDQIINYINMTEGDIDVRSIAINFGCCPEWVRMLAIRLGRYDRKLFKWTKSNDRRLKSLWANHTMKEIAQRLGTTARSVEARILVLRKRGEINGKRISTKV